MPRLRTHRSDTATLPIIGHTQTDDYSCGVLAGWSVVEFFHSKSDFRSFYKDCAPSPRWGTSTAKLSAALRKHGVTVSVRKNLGFAELKESIQGGKPILVSISTVTEKFWHWVVVYGVGWNPRRVCISASLPGRSRKEVLSWRAFERHWRPHGFALVCRARLSRATKAGKPCGRTGRSGSPISGRLMRRRAAA